MVGLRNRRRTRQTFVFLSSIALLLTLFNLSAMNTAQAAPTAIAGTVYRDYDANGAQDTLEPGIQGIIITAYGNNNAVVGSATSADDGTYSLTATGAGPFRLEFTPNADQQSWLSAGPAQAATGATQVVIVNDGATAVDVGFADPSQHCQRNPDILTTCFVFGDHETALANDAGVTTAYLDLGVTVPHTVEINIDDVGSVYGLAYQRTTNAIYSSAFMKRHSDFGDNGPGAVYVTDRDTGNTTLFADLNNISLPNGTLLPASTAGVDPRDPSDIVGTYAYAFQGGTQTVSAYWYHDPDVFELVGKFSIGDIDIAGDDSAIYVVNMYDRKLYTIGTDTIPATNLAADPVAIPNTCANPDDARPMAVKAHDGKVYVGTVCSAESSQNLAELKGEVFIFDPLTNSFDTNPVLTIPLNYDRGCIYRFDMIGNTADAPDVPPTDCKDADGTQSNDANWRPWTPNWEDVYGAGTNSGSLNDQFFIEYPTPLLSDIEFDNGNMIIGFRDLNGDRTGYCAGVPDSSYVPLTGCDEDETYRPGGANEQPYGQGIYRGNGMGDILRACGDTVNGWTLENNGSCSTPIGQNNQQGPGGGEFYWNDQSPGGLGVHLSDGAAWWTTTGGHDQTVIGALLQVPGNPHVVTHQIDSSTVYNAGLVYFSNEDGGVWDDLNGDGDNIDRTLPVDGDGTGINWGDGTINIDAGEETRKSVIYGTGAVTFGKANGLGDLEAFCEAAPTQVGNLVWDDANANGVQDPSESGIAGVQLTLTCGSDSTSVTTAADGTYLFTNDASADASAANIAIATWMDNGEACSIEVTGGAPTGSEITEGTMAISDLHDNDADENGIINFTVGDAGENNHNLDIGYTDSNSALPAGNAAIGNYVWLDENNDGVQDAGEPGIANVTVMMTEAGGATYQTVTDADGGYLFPDLPAGTYTVKVNDANFVANGPLDGYTQTTLTPAGAAYDADFGNKDDAGYVIVLDWGEENLSADFGYNVNSNNEVNNNTGNAAVGDRVWIDLDGDGVQDPNEVGVEGVGLTLYSAGPDGLFGTDDDVAEEQTTTDENGNYMFDDVTPGAYKVCVTSSSGAAADILDGSAYAQTGDPDHFARAAATLGSDPMGLAGDHCSTQPVVLAPGDVYLNVDFGYQPEDGTPVGSIGNTVWFDADADQNGPAGVNGDSSNGAGANDTNENPIEGVTVALIKDLDGDGTFDGGEPIVASDTTDENGQYFFGGLPLEQCAGGGAGVDQDYIVWVNDTNAVLSDMVGTFDADGDSGNGTVLTADAVYGLSATTINCTTPDDVDQDFGYTKRGHFSGRGLVGDYVWLDTDGDGVQDPDEAGIEGVTLTIYDSTNSPIGATVTDENGLYAFGNLDLNADYTVQVDASNFNAGGVLEGMSQTYDNAAPDDNTSSSATLTSGAPVDLTLDFGYRGTNNGRLGNLVWLDDNADGVYDAADGENTIGDVTLALYRDLDCDGLVGVDDVLFGQETTVSAINVVSYSADGIYRFNRLPIVGAGPNGGACYVVDVTDDNGVLAGYWHSLGTLATSNNSQPDPYGGDGVLELRSGATQNYTADFGYYVDPACVGNHVFVDGNNDNLQGDASDYGLGGVKLTLDIAYANGNVSMSTLSEGDGFYQFCNLLLDEDYNDSTSATEPDFTISAETPAGYTRVESNAGSDDLNDSDADGVAALPEQGATDVSAEDPATDESDPIASYDFGFDGSAPATDYGDAPDSYGTTSAEDGAAHTLNGLYLGSCVDGEGNGLPDPFAGTASTGGDDNSAGPVTGTCTDGDDEDGITTDDATWTEGANGATVSVDASADGCLNAWVDFNRDGVFLGANEHVIVNQLVDSNTGNISFDVPSGGTDEPTFARYRLSPRDSGLCTETVEPTGLVDGGEVEDFRYDFGAVSDFGDLPDSYGGTRAGEDGASHVITPGLSLGSTVDGEADGQPSTQANGDGGDEDGVVPVGDPTEWLEGTDGGEIIVTVTGEGCLNAWFDWNVDGSFEGPGEQIITNLLVDGTTGTISFDIPTGGIEGSDLPRYARYRLTPRDGDNGCSEVIGATGSVVGGEVEDYRYIVNEPTAVTLNGVQATPTLHSVIAILATALLSLTAVIFRPREAAERIR